MQKTESLGRHILVEASGCRNEALNDLPGIRQAMIDAAVAAGATVLDVSFRKFAPQGVSGVVIISESHLTIHTWPEYGYAAIDLFTCGDKAEPWRAFEVLAGFLEADQLSTIELRRGDINNLGNAGSPKREALFSHGYAAGSGSGL